MLGKFEIEAQFQRPFVQFFFPCKIWAEEVYQSLFLFYPVFDFMRVYFQDEIINYMYLIQGSV